jgi:hypothetical protein
MRIPKLNHVGRLLVGLLGPAIISSFTIVVYVFVSAGIKEGLSIEMFQIVLKGFVLFWVVGSLFIGIQSLAYTIVMEFIVRPKVRPRNAYLVVSCILGAVSGLLVDVIFDNRPFFIIFGMIVGLLTGLILYDKDLQSSHNKSMQPDAAKPHR